MKRHDEATKRRAEGKICGALFLTVILFLAMDWGARAHEEAGGRGVPAAHAWTVTDPSDNPSSPGAKTLRGIVGRAADGDVVTFDAEIGEILLQGELVINKDLVITGRSPNERVTIRQTASGVRALSVPSARTVFLHYLEITGNGSVARSNGGGISNSGKLTILDCHIFGNLSGFFGGGIANEHGGDLTIGRSRVRGNRAPSGGGIFNFGNLTMERCDVEVNESSSEGGGIFNYNTMTLLNCTIRYNRSIKKGGGIYNGATTAMDNCTVQGNSADTSGGGIFNNRRLTLYGTRLMDNTATIGGGIDSEEGFPRLLTKTMVYNNTPDQIRGEYWADETCIIGTNFGKSSMMIEGVAEGVSPTPRATSGEADVTAVENDLKTPESGIFTAVKNALSADLGGHPGGVSAGLSSIDERLYDAFAYENVPLADASGEGELVVEFTASWPRSVRYYAAFAEYEDAAASAHAVKGYVLPDRGVQFETKPGQPLPDGAVPPDFYEEGEGLMTWRNVIADNGPYDHNRQVGVVTFRVASIRAEAQTAPTSGSGCAVGSSPVAILLALPLLLVLRK